MQVLALTAGLAVLGAGAALADPPGWTTVPDPGASFGWEVPRPTQKPRARPAPAPAAVPAATTVTPTPTTTPAPKPRHAHRARVHHSRPQTPPARRDVVVRPQRTGAVLAAHVSTSRATYESALLLAALGLAIACFACGAAPAAHIRWRRGAAFVAYRRTNITTAGVVFLLAAAVVFVLTRN